MGVVERIFIISQLISKPIPVAPFLTKNQAELDSDRDILENRQIQELNWLGTGALFSLVILAVVY